MLTTKLIDHRVLIVLEPDTGALRGAHSDKLIAVYDGEQQIAVKPENGVPIDDSDLAAVLPSQSSLAVRVQRLTDQLADMTADRDTHRTARETAEAQVASLTTERDGLADDKAGLTSQLSEAQAAKATAEESVSSLTEQLAAAQSRIAELEQPVPLVNGVPQQVTNYQARSALISADLFSAVDAAVKAQGPASQAYHAWEYANVFSRSSPFIADMGAALGLTTEQIDALFVAAAQVN